MEIVLVGVAVFFGAIAFCVVFVWIGFRTKIARENYDNNRDEQRTSVSAPITGKRESHHWLSPGLIPPKPVR
jgi:hypothetical protein